MSKVFIILYKSSIQTTFEVVQDVLCNPHEKHKEKTCSRYTKENRKKSNYTTKKSSNHKRRQQKMKEHRKHKTA